MVVWERETEHAQIQKPCNHMQRPDKEDDVDGFTNQQLRQTVICNWCTCRWGIILLALEICYGIGHVQGSIFPSTDIPIVIISFHISDHTASTCAQVQYPTVN